MKKKDNLANDAAMFFLVAVISVSLSVFASEVNTITRDSAAQAVGATTTSPAAAELQAQLSALQAQIAALSSTPTTPTITTITDYSLLKNCFLKQKTAGGLCSITDLNSDGVTNFADIALAKATSGSATSTSPSTYDLNGDGKVNFIETVVTTTSSGSGTLSDLTLFKSCFFKTSPLTGICALSDFNGDGAINFGDLALWKANNGSTSSSTIAKYDLNSDGKISYIYDADIEPATTTLTDYNLLRYCFFSKPLGICSIADFNNDRAINFGDLSLAKANLNATDLASIEKYDLTGDGKVNYFPTALLATSTVNDLDLLKSCFFKGPSLTGVCSLADFNNDGYVNFGDLTLFKQNLSSRDPLVIQKYDLNGDGRIWWFVSTEPKITVIYPNGGEVWQEGSAQTIRWSSQSLPSDARVGIELSRQPRGDNKMINAYTLSPSDSSYTWKVNTVSGWGFGAAPSQKKFSKILGVKTVYADGVEYKVWVRAGWGDYRAGTDKVIEDGSDATFTTTGTSSESGVRVISPNGGESIKQGSYYSVWFESNTDVISIQLVRNNIVVQTLCSGNVDSGTTACNLTGGNIYWKFDVPVGSGYKIRINKVNNTLGDESDNTFSVVTASTSTPSPVDAYPTISLPLPKDGAIIANVSDDKGIAGVQFKINGTNCGSEITPNYYPYRFTLGKAFESCPLPSTTPYIITAVARDTAGQKTTSNSVPVTLSDAVYDTGGQVTPKSSGK